MDYARYFTELGAGLMALIFLPFLVMLILRSRKIPRCFACGAAKVRPTRAVGFWDIFAGAFMIRPFRCEGCRERFYGLRGSGESRKPSALQVSPRQRVVKVAFRFRSGSPNRIVIRVVDPPRDPAGSAAILHI
jgi:hypothetical protein